MADERLRALRRRWEETGSVDDEAAYLRERVRAGELTLARLELAAHGGHEAARLACGGGVAATSLTDWLHAMSAWGPHVQLRSLAFTGRALLPLWQACSQDARPRLALDAIDDWVARPSRKRAEAVRGVVKAVTDCAAGAFGWVLREVGLDPSWEALEPPIDAVRCVEATALAVCATARLCADGSFDEHVERGIEAAASASRADPDAVLERVRAATRAWALATS